MIDQDAHTIVALDNETAQGFTKNALAYTITTQVNTAIVEVELSDKEILTKFYNANHGNTLG
ncbi:hypothetical protein ATE84_3271 [Aquimarina sp. MAR_2010_214]|uniref:hypothetical protein n=1 Tax=Aquimarina sp. MAR_2010_214 TaxID=1250026 RepID=UPI000C706B13|nr:hypothetical protein [Aquimarina sp. MAR_2010_214]PKV51197.1 hypothetical protein ATE84_3271 [Aquimarina sp. MAR_2010_214]